jgi:hypothetical protein
VETRTHIKNGNKASQSGDYAKKMKNTMKILGAIMFASLILTSCRGGGEIDSDKTTLASAKKEAKPIIRASNSKAAIKTISEKYYIPIVESKSDLIFTINQNLNFSLVNYKGSFEGKYFDGKVQFDDKNSTLIDFVVKGEIVVLKNQNDVEVEFREATDEELLTGTWHYDLGGSPLRMIFDKSGNWSVPDDPFGTRKGQFKKIAPKKFTIPKYTVGITATLTLNSPTSFILIWESGGPFGQQKLNHKKAQKSKQQSLNQIFN